MATSSDNATRQRLQAKLAAKQRAEQNKSEAKPAADESTTTTTTTTTFNDEHHHHQHQEEPEATAAPKWYESNAVKALLFCSIVPICFAIPFTIEYVIDWTRPYGEQRVFDFFGQ